MNHSTPGLPVDQFYFKEKNKNNNLQKPKSKKKKVHGYPHSHTDPANLSSQAWSNLGSQVSIRLRKRRGENRRHSQHLSRQFLGLGYPRAPLPPRRHHVLSGPPSRALRGTNSSLLLTPLCLCWFLCLESSIPRAFRTQLKFTSSVKLVPIPPSCPGQIECPLLCSFPEPYYGTCTLPTCFSVSSTDCESWDNTLSLYTSA